MLSACEDGIVKETQYITFSAIPSQNLMDSTYQLAATATSGLPITYMSSNDTVATIDSMGKISFKTTGVVEIKALQSGNDDYYEAPSITRTLKIRGWDSNKKDQTISFDLVSEWRISKGTVLELDATSSSGLPITYTSSNDIMAWVNGGRVTLYHGTKTYDITVYITASQVGNDIYNPAENVVRELHVIGDQTH